MPFLYLPDAISLTLLLILAGLLRRSAIMHVRQELIRLRGEILVYWADKGLPLANPVYVRLRRQIDSSIELSPIVTPARLFFTSRLYREAEKCGFSYLLPNTTVEIEEHVERIGDNKTRDKLRRFQLEIDLRVGTLYLMASISGWILMIPIFFRIFTRSFSGGSKNRVDRLFDLGERVLSRLGRRVQQIAVAAVSHSEGQAGQQ